ASSKYPHDPQMSQPPVIRSPVQGRKWKDSPWLVLIAGGLAFGLGIWGAYCVVVQSWTSWASVGWARTRGVVTSSHMAPAVDKFTCQWWPNVEYCYRVGDADFDSNVISVIDGPAPRRADAWTIRLQPWEETELEYRERQLNEKYPVNGAVTVYYNPAHPAE